MALNGRVDRREEEEARAPLRLCSWPEHLEADCILNVEGTEVQVNKTYLSKRSRFFHCLFNGDFVEQRNDRYEVNGVDAEAFIEMLRVVLPSRKPVDENNVESLLYFADRFMMDRLTKKCVKFLCGRSRAARSISSVVLVQLAFQYRNETLKIKARTEIFCLDNINALRECPRFGELEREELEFICNIALRHNAAKWQLDMDCDCPTCVLAGSSSNSYRSRMARRILRLLDRSLPVTYRNPGGLQYPPTAGCGSCDYCQARRVLGMPINANPFVTYPNLPTVPYLVPLIPVVPIFVPVVLIAVPVVPIVVTWYYQ